MAKTDAEKAAAVGTLARQYEALAAAEDDAAKKAEYTRLALEAVLEQAILLASPEGIAAATKALIDFNTEAAKTAKAAAELEAATKDMESSAASLAETLGGLIGLNATWEKSLLGTIDKISQSEAGIAKFNESMNKMVSISNLANAAMRATRDATLLFARAQEAAFAEFNKSTGALRLYKDEIRSLNHDMFIYGVTIQDASDATGHLVRNVTDLNSMNSSTVRNLQDTTSILAELGVAGDVTTSNIQFMTKSLGIGAETSAKFQRELFALGQEIGMPPGEMAEQFQAAKPVLSAFGKEAGKVFKDLAVNARKAGLEVSDLLDITGKFDTFETAAESVGQLNAILGGPYLNSMEMVMETDPTKRMQMLSQALNKTGKSFETMTYYERKSIAAAMGFKDVDQLAKVMAGNFDNAAGGIHKTKAEMEKLQEQQREFATLWEKASEVMRQFAIDAAPLIEGLKYLLQGLNEVIKKVDEWTQSATNGTVGFAGLFAAVTSVFIVVKAFVPLLRIIGGLKLKDTIATWAQVGAEKALGKVQKRRAKFMGTFPGKAAGVTAASVGMVFALAALVASVGAAALGVAELAKAFSNLHGDQIWAATLAIAAFGATIVLTIGAITGMTSGPQTPFVWAAVGVIAAIGAAAWMAGKGVELLGKGFMWMGEGFSTFVTAYAANSTELLAFPAFLITTAGAMQAFTVGAALGIPAMIATGFALRGLVKKLEAKTDFNKSLTELNDSFVRLSQAPVDDLKNVGEAMKTIVDQVDRISPLKALLLSKVLNQSGVLARAAAATTPTVLANVNASARGDGTGTGSTVNRFEISLNIDGREFDAKVINVGGNKISTEKKGGGPVRSTRGRAP